MTLLVGDCFEFLETGSSDDRGVWKVTRVTAGLATARKDRMVKRRVEAKHEWVVGPNGQKRRRLLDEPIVKEFMVPSQETLTISANAHVKACPCSHDDDE